VVGFADAELNALLGVDPSQEATIALVALGRGAPRALPAPDVAPLELPVRALSAHQVDYPDIVQAHAESSLPSGAAAAAWRAAHPSSASPGPTPPRETAQESIESVILRRGSTRRFADDPIAFDQLQTLLAVATSPVDADVFVAADLYLIINAVDGLASGVYFYDRASRRLESLRPGTFRREAAYLDLTQSLAGEAAVDVYWLTSLEALDDRGYRAAQLSAALEAGKLYLAAYTLGLGATGLTFFDDDVTRFFSPHAAGKRVMFLTAVGRPAKSRR
jgi:nitroreductase